MKATEILSQLNTGQLKDKVVGYPTLIIAQKQVVRAARAEYNDCEQERAAQEAMLMAEITAAVNLMTNKPMFSNAEARQAELLKQKRIATDYLDAEHTARQAETVLNQAQDELDKLFDEYKSTCFILGLVTAEVNLWARELVEAKPALVAETELRPVA